jgi:hypothetical protein
MVGDTLPAKIVIGAHYAAGNCLRFVVIGAVVIGLTTEGSAACAMADWRENARQHDKNESFRNWRELVGRDSFNRKSLLLICGHRCFGPIRTVDEAYNGCAVGRTAKLPPQAYSTHKRLSSDNVRTLDLDGEIRECVSAGQLFKGMCIEIPAV